MKGNARSLIPLRSGSRTVPGFLLHTRLFVLGNLLWTADLRAASRLSFVFSPAVLRVPVGFSLYLRYVTGKVPVVLIVLVLLRFLFAVFRDPWAAGQWRS